MPSRRWLAWLAVVLGGTIATSARGATADDEAGAERLFQEAKALMAAGQVHEACSKLTEAKRLEVGGGIVLALALCHEKEGRGASALVEFREALALAIEAKRADRVRLAEEEAARLETRVSTLTVIAPEGAEVHVNREVWGHAQLGVAVPVDAGDYVVRAEAPGKKAWEETVHFAAEGDARTVEVPALTLDEPTLPVVAPPPARIQPERQVVVPEKPAVGGSSGDGRGARIAGLAVGGAGIVGLGVAAVFGVLAAAKRSEASCQGRVCAGAADMYESSQTDATAATVAAIVGGVALGTGAILFLTHPAHHTDASRAGAFLEIAPRFSVNGASIGISGVF